ncbi:hypothetical protein [Streptomyces sp. NPDC004579]|uniref:hypothetical protein n=1 Tax=Streptomyces sp. NPDC004579 TaxID=3154667 RepID=UPI0033A46E2B
MTDGGGQQQGSGGAGNARAGAHHAHWWGPGALVDGGEGGPQFGAGADVVHLRRLQMLKEAAFLGAGGPPQHERRLLIA